MPAGAADLACAVARQGPGAVLDKNIDPHNLMRTRFAQKNALIINMLMYVDVIPSFSISLVT